MGGAAALQAGGDVDGVSGEEPLARGGVDIQTHQRLAGVDADPDLDRLAADAGQGVDLVDRGAGRPVTARSGSSSCRTGTPKTATTASPMNFSTVAAVGLDRLAGDGVVAAQEAVDQLGVVALAERR